MIVKDEETLEEALQMLAASPEGVRYSDTYNFSVFTTPETLELYCRRVLARNDIAVVIPRGYESSMEDHSTCLREVRKQRAEDEKRNVKKWIREHPEVVERIKKELE